MTGWWDKADRAAYWVALGSAIVAAVVAAAAVAAYLFGWLR